MGRPELERPSFLARPLTRRNALKLAGFGGLALLASACEKIASSKTKSLDKPYYDPKYYKETPKLSEPTVRVEKPSQPIKEKEYEVLWVQELLIPPNSPSNKILEAFFISDDKIFFATPDGYPIGLNLKGERLWQWEDKGTVYGVEPETVYVVRTDKRFYALDSRTGQTKWRTILGVDQYTNVDWPLRIFKDNVYLPFWRPIPGGGFEFIFVNIDKKNGGILGWREGEILGQTEKTLVVDSWKSGGEGLDALTGEKKWGPVNIGGKISETFLYYCQNGSMFEYDIDSGKIVWQSEQMKIGEIIAIYKDRVYATFSSTNGNYLTVVDRQTGKKLWGSEPFGPNTLQFAGEINGTAVVENENLGFTYGIDAQTGQIIWENDDLRINRLVGVSKNTLIGICLNPPQIYGLDIKNGQRKWRWDVNERLKIANSVIANEKVVFEAAYTGYGGQFETKYLQDQYIAILKPETGQIVTKIPQPTRTSKRFIPYKNLLLTQIGSPGTKKGSLSTARL